MSEYLFKCILTYILTNLVFYLLHIIKQGFRDYHDNRYSYDNGHYHTIINIFEGIQIEQTKKDLELSTNNISREGKNKLIKNNVSCVVCLNYFEKDDNIVNPHNIHDEYYHRDCFEKWCSKRYITKDDGFYVHCPICRDELKLLPK